MSHIYVLRWNNKIIVIVIVIVIKRRPITSAILNFDVIIQRTCYVR